MIIFLMLILLLFLFVAYYGGKRDVTSPTVLLIFGYALSTYFYYLNRNDWFSNLSVKTVIVIATGIVAFGFTEQVINLGYRSKKGNEAAEIKYIKVPGYKLVICMGIQLIALIMLFTSIKSISRVLAGDLSTILGAYKTIHLATGEDFGFVTNILVKCTYAISYIFSYIFISNCISTKKIRKNIILIFPMLCGVIATILLSNRITLILYFVYFIMCYVLINNRNTIGFYRPKLDYVLKILVYSIVFLFFFYLLKDVIGRNSSAVFFDYISVYAGSSIPNLNNYIESGPVEHFSRVYEILPGMINSLHKLGLVAHSASKTLEFRLISNTNYSNVYSGLRRMYNSGGILGVIFFQTIFAGLMTALYKDLRYNRDSQYWFGLKLIIFCKMAYTIPLQAIEDHFFIDDISIGFIIETLLLIFLYVFVFKVKFTARKTLKQR